jgi:ADP-ribose pyrophosphatase
MAESSSKAAPLPPYPGLEIHSQETVWNGRFPVERIAFTQLRFDGARSGERVWELWRRGRAAALLPYDPVADAVILIEQFRLPALAAAIDPIMVEIPAGLCDPGETAQTTLLREAVEEMGLSPSRLHPIGDFLLTPGGSDELVHIAVGEMAVPAAGPDGLLGRAGLASENEDIQIRVWPATRAIAAALAGEFPNSVTTIALLWLASRRDWLRAEWSRPA